MLVLTKLRNGISRLERVVFALIGLGVGILILGARALGWLQPLELTVYDLLLQLQPRQPVDERLLIVAITEEDVQRRQWPFADGVYAELLTKLDQAQPRVIGLDIYRDYPLEPGHQQLIQTLTHSERMIVITKWEDAENPSNPPPPGVPLERVGFNDIVVDPDGTVRRNLILLTDQGENLPSFGLLAALKYLASEGITPTASPINPDYLQLGPATLIPLEATAGNYQQIDNRGYQLLLQFNHAPLRQVSLGAVLAGQVDPALIRDRVVLIGSTASSLKDSFYTPLSRGNSDNQKNQGVMLHGTMTSQIIRAALGELALPWFWSETAESLWILVWGLGGAGLARRLRNPLILFGGSGILLAVILGLGYGALIQQGWIPIVAPALALTTSAIGSVAYTAQQAQRQRRMVMTLLGQSTSPEIAQTLWRSRDRLTQSGKLPGQSMTATLLFTDLAHFSTISEQIPPEQLLEWLNEYLEVLTQTVQDHQGIVNKFTGDGVMAVFGVPVARTAPRAIAQDAQHAVACGLAMGLALEQLNQQWAARGLPEVRMRVGIFTGPVVAGSLGGKNRLEYGVIGDTVNIASRLESYDKDRHTDLCRVLIGKETLVYLMDDIAVESWGPLALKGKQNTIEVYRVLGWKSGAIFDPPKEPKGMAYEQDQPNPS